MFGLAVVFGCIIGFALGLTGGGGGVFAIPLLVYGLGFAPREAVGISLASVGDTALLLFSGIEIHRAVGTSLLVIFLISISGVTSYLAAGRELSLDTTIQFLVGGLVGIWIGGLVAKKLKGPTLQKVFAFAVVLAAIFVIVKTVFLISRNALASGFRPRPEPWDSALRLITLHQGD